MNRRWWCKFLVILSLSGCAAGSAWSPGDTLPVGQREAELVAQKGQPQEVKPLPEGGKIYVYRQHRLDQVAAMGGGAWGKPDEVYYWLNEQGVITRVAHYPYGKKKFLFPTAEPAVSAALTPAPALVVAAREEREKVTGPPAASPTQLPPEPAKETARPPLPASAAIPGKPEMSAATRLEIDLTRDEVQRLLGLPERTEGFRVKGRGVIVWFYQLTDPQGRRVLTPVVFENGRVSGWGDTHYRRLLKEASGEKP